jgi:hypothetical protein
MNTLPVWGNSCIATKHCAGSTHAEPEAPKSEEGGKNPPQEPDPKGSASTQSEADKRFRSAPFDELPTGEETKEKVAAPADASEHVDIDSLSGNKKGDWKKLKEANA